MYNDFSLSLQFITKALVSRKCQNHLLQLNTRPWANISMYVSIANENHTVNEHEWYCPWIFPKPMFSINCPKYCIYMYISLMIFFGIKTNIFEKLPTGMLNLFALAGKNIHDSGIPVNQQVSKFWKYFPGVLQQRFFCKFVYIYIKQYVSSLVFPFGVYAHNEYYSPYYKTLSIQTNARELGWQTFSRELWLSVTRLSTDERLNTERGRGGISWGEGDINDITLGEGGVKADRYGILPNKHRLKS